MDYFLAKLGRLAGFVCVVALASWSRPASATSIYADWQSAMSACQSSLHTATTNGYRIKVGCSAGSYPGGYSEWFLEYYYTGTSGTFAHLDFPYRGAAPANPCTGPDVPNMTGLFPGRILKSYSWCKGGVPDPVSGGTVSCVMTFSNSGLPTRNQWGSWSTPGTLVSTGATCDGSGGGGSNNWKNPDGTPASDPIPPSPAVDPPKNPAPKTCGGGSCYDPTNDNFCAVADGVQVCVPGGPARGDNGGANAGTPNGNAPGACSSSASATVCAGSPTAPKPSPSNVPDPPTQVRSNDTYTQANPSTGTPIVVQTTTYSSGNASAGSSPTSGQQAGDSGPASSSSTSTPSGSYGGGGDCNSPPVCSGDAVMCGVARQEWTAMCQAKSDAAQLHKDLAGDGPPADFDALKNKYGQGDVWSGPDTSLDGTVGGQANSGIYDQSGFGYGTACPLHDISISLGSRGSFVIPLEDKCVIGTWLRALVIGFALLSAAIITAGGRGL